MNQSYLGYIKLSKDESGLVGYIKFRKDGLWLGRIYQVE